MGINLSRGASSPALTATASRSAMPSRSITIHPMISADVPRTVEVHLSAFPGFFLSILGARFLRLFYTEAVTLGEITFVAREGETIVGFAMGSVEPASFFRSLLRRRLMGFAFAAAPVSIRHPTTCFRIARALAKPREAAKPKGTATLLSLGVAREVQGLGAGKALVNTFLQAAASRGSSKVDLTTDKMDNEHANAFYSGLGFRLAREIVTRERRVLNEYEMDLPGR